MSVATRHLIIATCGLGMLLLGGCAGKPVAPPKVPLYERLGGEETLVALSLQVSRDDRLAEIVNRRGERFFRMRLHDHLCIAASGPCEPVGTETFQREFALGETEARTLRRVMAEELERLEVQSPEAQELLRVSGLPN